MPEGLSPEQQPPCVVEFVGAEIQPSLGSPIPECAGLRPPEPPRRDTVPSIQKGSVYTDSHILLTLSVLENANLQDKRVDVVLSMST